MKNNVTRLCIIVFGLFNLPTLIAMERRKPNSEIVIPTSRPLQRANEQTTSNESPSVVHKKIIIKNPTQKDLDALLPKATETSKKNISIPEPRTQQVTVNELIQNYDHSWEIRYNPPEVYNRITYPQNVISEQDLLEIQKLSLGSSYQLTLDNITYEFKSGCKFQKQSWLRHYPVFTCSLFYIGIAISAWMLYSKRNYIRLELSNALKNIFAHSRIS